MFESYIQSKSSTEDFETSIQKELDQSQIRKIFAELD